MAGNGPNVLVVANDRAERTRIASMLHATGFAAVAAEENSDALAALRRERFAAAVIALPENHGVELMSEARHRQPGLPALLVLDAAVMPFVDDECEAIVRRPFDAHQLLGRVFDLVLLDDDCHRAELRHGYAAEQGIAAAKMACLYGRLASAGASGASPLARDLSRQIDETAALQDGFGAVMRIACSLRDIPAGAA